MCSSRVYSNAVAKSPHHAALLVGDAIDSVSPDAAGLSLRRPVDRGHVVNWELQKTLWLRGLRSRYERVSSSSPSAPPPAPFKNPKRLGEAAGGAVITLPLLCLDSVAEAAREVAFEELGYSKVAFVPSAELAVASWCHDEIKEAEGAGAASSGALLPAASARSAIAVDVGFSATTACAVFDGRALLTTVRRVDLGGKALTNVLKDAASFRAVDLRQEGVVVEAMKEGACFVSLDLARDLELARRGLNALEWVLPDGTGEFGPGGKARPRLTKEERKAAAKAAALEARAAAEKAATEASAAAASSKKRPLSASASRAPRQKEQKPKEETVVPLTLERFMVPEALFYPSDVGLPQGGIQEAVAACAAAAPASLRPLLLSNVLLFGGGAACPGISERLERELRPLVPAAVEVAVRVASSGKEGTRSNGENGENGGGSNVDESKKANASGPALAPWRGGSLLAGNSEWFESRATTREQWEEARREQRREREKLGRFGGGGGGGGARR
jgi:actin-related protein 6